MLRFARQLLAPVTLALLAPPTFAADPKPIDLADLKDAVKAAGKKGANVDEVETALAAVEKLVAKGFTPVKSEAAPPAELAALREAVEAAGRKGENVDAIRTELAVVETTMAGRVLTAARPELPPLGFGKPDPLPDPVLGRRGGFERAGGFGGGRVGGGFGGGFAGRRGVGGMSITVENNAFTLRAVQNGVEYEVTGKIGGEQPEVTKIVIFENGEKTEAESVKKLPEDHRDAVERFLKFVR